METSIHFNEYFSPCTPTSHARLFNPEAQAARDVALFNKFSSDKDGVEQPPNMPDTLPLQVLKHTIANRAGKPFAMVSQEAS